MHRGLAKWAFLIVAASACSASKESSEARTDGSVQDGFGDGEFNVDGLATDTAIELPGTLEGKVVAPEGTIPIFGALVYTTTTAPPAIPDQVYCDKCVRLTDGTPYTTTKPDGTFSLPTTLGQQYLVVQKGAFRRVRSLEVVAGTQTVPKEMTTLPPKTDKAKGDDVPKIAVALGAWDPIELVLARLGLEAKITKDFLGKARVLSKDATGFAIYGLHELNEVSPHPTAEKLLSDPAEISKHHIVFKPCSGSTQFESGDRPFCGGVYVSNTKSTIDGFVKAGGRVYVSDWSYEYVRQIFPGFVTWKNQSTVIGSACEQGGGDQPAKVEDTDLAAWFAAQGRTFDTVKEAWTHIDKVNPTQDLDPEGKPVSVTPKVWVSAAGAPATTSFEHSCGRVLYTTYHTEPTSEATGPLDPQSLALLYLILEVNVCVGPPVIK